MKPDLALKMIFMLGFAGTLFAGYLSYTELVGSCTAGCPVVATGTILGYPACVYGFVMFGIITLIAGFGLIHSRKK
ncbi:hypothetical protein GF380_03025 [Candidatus Uhrbacteria bacterium]|nr:hypothetical protein [Candidatus Uhrbacteria bacterium]MBD3284120.1 hypothetical protein [Candidatus Uhrbacteria bacterium]